MNVPVNKGAETAKHFEEAEEVVIRFAGDSGDGMQLTGSQFTASAALAGNDFATFPDFPAEIRAPTGTTFGVSAFQINFGSGEILTAGDQPDVLVVMNPAALKVNLKELREGGILVIDTGAFTKRNLQKAGYDENPLDGDSLARYHHIELDISSHTLEAVKEFGLSNKEAIRSKNMWTLGLMLWMFGRPRQQIIDWLNDKFASKPDIAAANVAALNAGHAFGETAEMSADLKRYHIAEAKTEPGTYSTVTGAQALAWGLVAGSQLADLPLFLGSYPITPASPLLHQLAALKEFEVTSFQAEDEIAAIGAAIGASYAGSLGITSSSGPGIALKGEAMGLAISAELPLVIVNAQRGGPSTGLPTKTEQSDLYQAIYGRNGDAPMPVISARGPGDCFYVAIEAVRLAVKYMTPVMLLTDGYITNAAEPWKLPDATKLRSFPATFATEADGMDENFDKFARDPETLTKPWVKPGTKGLEYRAGGLEKSFETGHISYDPDNHQKMTDTRFDKVAAIAKDIPQQKVYLGEDTGPLAVVGWGSTFGPIDKAVKQAIKEGKKVSHIHLRHLNPFPENLGKLLADFDKILVPEMNMGQLSTVLRDRFLLDVIQLNKVTGQPFKIVEIHSAIDQALSAKGEK